MKRRTFIGWGLGLTTSALVPWYRCAVAADGTENCPAGSFSLGMRFASAKTLENIAHLSGTAIQAVRGASLGQPAQPLPGYFDLTDRSLMSQYGWSNALLPPPDNQKEQSSCVAWAVGYSMGTFLNNIRSAISQTPNNAQLISPADLYAKILRREPGKACGDATLVKDAFDVMVDEGVASLSASPYSSAKCARPENKSLYFLDGYHRLSTSDSLAIKSQLSSFLVLPFGMSVHSDFESFRGDGVYVHSANDASCALGGHCMSLVGFDDAKSAYRIMNSWGKNWGGNGLAWIEYGTFNRLVAEIYCPYSSTPVGRLANPPQSSSSKVISALAASAQTTIIPGAQSFDKLLFYFKLNNPISVNGYSIRAINRSNASRDVYSATLNQFLRASLLEVPLRSAGERSALSNTAYFALDLSGTSRDGEKIDLTVLAKYPNPSGR